MIKNNIYFFQKKKKILQTKNLKFRKKNSNKTILKSFKNDFKNNHNIKNKNLLSPFLVTPYSSFGSIFLFFESSFEFEEETCSFDFDFRF